MTQPKDLNDLDASPFLKACIDLIGRTAAQELSLDHFTTGGGRRPDVWIAVARWEGLDGTPRWEAAGALTPDQAAYRLAEIAIDGGLCKHCNRITGVDDQWQNPPAGDGVCWYRFDPELVTFRRTCEGLERQR